MEYQIGPFKILADENRIISATADNAIRPKTLELLLYFIQHPQQIISKQSLLDEVWQSAGAQEYVLFQSINEIRGLLKPLNVIKTHPRKGYQWLYPTSTPENEVPPQTKRHSKWRREYTALFSGGLLIAILVIGVMANYSQQARVTFQKIPTPSRELVVLPITNHIADNKHLWVRLGGMDMLIQALNAEKRFVVPDAEDVMMALARSDAFNIVDIEQQSRTLRNQLGEVVTLHTKLLGAPMEYQLHYSLIGRYNIKQGIIFAAQVPELLHKLSVDISTLYNDPTNNQRSNINELTADNNFLQAMESFYRGEYSNARHQFSTLLTRQSDNLTAKRFLLKTLVALGEYAQAQQFGENILNQAKEQNDNQNYLRSLFELGILASHQQQLELANRLFSQSRDLAEKNNDTLYIAYAHTELGILMAHNKQWAQASELFQSALIYHQGFQCPYGQISNLQALADVEQQQANLPSSLSYFDEALNIAEDNALYYHQVNLLVSKINISGDNMQRQHWLTQAEQIVAQQGDIDLKRYLQSQLTDRNLSI